MKPDIEGKIERCPCCGSMLEVSQSDEQTASFISVNGPELKAEIESLREKLAAAEEKIKYEADVNAALSKQSQEYWQDRELCAEYNRELTEKLALSEAAGAEMRLALTEIAEYWSGSTSQGSMEDACLQAVTRANKALASDHGKAYLDVVRFARCKDSCSSILNDTPSLCDCGFKDAIDGLPGRKGE